MQLRAQSFAQIADNKCSLELNLFRGALEGIWLEQVLDFAHRGYYISVVAVEVLRMCTYVCVCGAVKALHVYVWSTFMYAYMDVCMCMWLRIDPYRWCRSAACSCILWWFMFVCMCVCIYMYVCVYMYMHVYVRMYVRMRVCVYMCVYVRMYVRMHVCVCMRYVCMLVCMYVYICMYVCIFVCMYVHFYSQCWN
jgi:hypothetical protein